MRYIDRVLGEAKQNWSNGEEPVREEGCYVSHVAYDIIQVKIRPWFIWSVVIFDNSV